MNSNQRRKKNERANAKRRESRPSSGKSRSGAEAEPRSGRRSADQSDPYDPREPRTHLQRRPGPRAATVREPKTPLRVLFFSGRLLHDIPTLRSVFKKKTSLFPPPESTIHPPTQHTPPRPPGGNLPPSGTSTVLSIAFFYPVKFHREHAYIQQGGGLSSLTLVKSRRSQE